MCVCVFYVFYTVYFCTIFILNKCSLHMASSEVNVMTDKKAVLSQLRETARCCSCYFLFKVRQQNSLQV